MASIDSSTMPVASGQPGIINPMSIRVISNVNGMEPPPSGFVLLRGNGAGPQKQVVGSADVAPGEDEGNDTTLDISSSGNYREYLEDLVFCSGGKNSGTKVQITSETVQNSKNEVSESKKAISKAMTLIRTYAEAQQM